MVLEPEPLTAEDVDLAPDFELDTKNVIPSAISLSISWISVPDSGDLRALTIGCSPLSLNTSFLCKSKETCLVVSFQDRAF